MASYVFVSTDTTDMIIRSAPFSWDGVSALTIPTGQQPLLAASAAASGYLTPTDAATIPAADLRAKAVGALASNITFLAIASPTQAQAVTQVKALTRQVNALIRLAAGALSTEDGT